ncbi:reverse transcriptase domain-containing protein [Tanacetum coccineum]
MWESAKIVALTPNSAIIQLDVDDNFVINSTHLNMIRENKFDGYLRADPHDHIREFLAICNMFRYGKTQSEAVKLMIFPLSLSDEAKTWFNELNEESITSWEQMRKAFINKFFPPLLFNRLLLEIRNFSQLVCENLTDAWLRLKSMLRKCHGHGLTKGAIIQIFYHGLDEPTQAILDVTAGGIFLYKTPNQAFQFLDDKVLFNHDWPIKSKNEHHRKSVSFADGSNNGDNSRLMEKLEALTKAIDSQIISLNEELQDIRNKYNELKEGNASKNHLNDDTPMCERHEANDIQSEGYQNQNSHDSYSHQSYHDPNDFEKSLTELNNDVKNDLEDFKRCIRSMRTIHDKIFDRDDVKTTGVLPNKISKPINQEPQCKTDFEKLVTKFLDDQRVTKHTYRTEPPPPQAHTKQVNVIFTESGNTHLKMILKNKFDGYLRADPHDHIHEFLAICDMFKYGETQSEAVKLLIFPYSLSDKAKTWFNELNEESITSWEQIRKAFINKFFPPSLFNHLLLEIRNFSQLVCKSLTEAWLRIKSMLRKCHGYGLTKGAIIQIFYHGLDEPTQGILDITAGGIFLFKSPNQAFQFLEDKVLFKLD